jgi:holo-[acyl-carrier protein] synthase
MILGIGVDLLSIPRFRQLIQRRGLDRVARRILSPPEAVEFEKVRSGSHDIIAERFLATR